ncbi:MAG: hypothetical protein HKN11_11585 [Rhizobiales bacterium]|nr:hypothetical protein [Hyphomicrobiales bacterium]
MSHTRYRFLTVIVATTALTGCGSGDFKETMGYGKYSPDETQVQANQSLSMPPSLQLRPPSGTQTQSAAAAPPQPSNLLAGQKVTAAPPQYGSVDPSQVPQVSAPAPEPQKLTAATPQAPVIDQTPAAPDVYDKLGISKVHPDGRPKTKSELINDLRKYKIAKEREKNPNYGSVFNSRSVVWE